MEPLPFTNGFYVSDSLPLSNQRCNNWFVNVAEAPTPFLESLYGTPGISQTLTTGDDPNRGYIVKDGIPYLVNGNKFYRFNREIQLISGIMTSVFSTTEIGTVEGEGMVSLEDNVNEIMILVPGGKGYIYNVNTEVFSEITDADFTANGNPLYLAFADGYFICTTDGKKWITSNLNQGLLWDALDRGTAESDPDKVVAPTVVNNQVFITGSITTEGFQNRGGGAGFPFIRNNIFLNKGCISPFTLVSFNSTFYMVGKGRNEKPSIWKFVGNGFSKLSTKAIDIVIGQYSDEDLNKAFAFSYSEDGNFFIGFTFPDHTFVYELVSQKWHERSSLVNEKETRWRPNGVFSAYERTFVTDSVDGRIGELSQSIYSEYNDIIIREMSTQPFYDKGNPITSTGIRLVMESGVGDLITRDPKVSLSMSKDGKLFGPERVRSIGKMGEFERQVIWYRNGRFPNKTILRFKMSDSIKPVILRLEYE